MLMDCPGQLSFPSPTLNSYIYVFQPATFVIYQTPRVNKVCTRCIEEHTLNRILLDLHGPDRVTGFKVIVFPLGTVTNGEPPEQASFHA